MACFGSKCVGVCRNLMSPTFLGVFLDVESDKKNRFKFRPLFHPPGPKHPFCFFCSYLLNERSDENRPFFCLFSPTILFYFWCWFFCNQKTRWSHSSFSRKSPFFVTNFLSPIFCHQIFLSPIFLDVFFDVEFDKKNRFKFWPRFDLEISIFLILARFSNPIFSRLGHFWKKRIRALNSS